jgi:hypothetical protein
LIQTGVIVVATPGMTRDTGSTKGPVRSFLKWTVRILSPGATMRSGPGTVGGLQVAKFAVHWAKPHMVITCASGIVFVSTCALSQYSAAFDVPAVMINISEANSKTLKFLLIVMDIFFSSSRLN